MSKGFLPDIAKDKALEHAADVALNVAERAASAVQSLMGGDTHNVQYRITFAHDPATSWLVRGIQLSESLSEPYRCTVEIATESQRARPGELLGRDVTLRCERPHRMERLVGMVARVTSGRTSDRHVTAQIQIVPALAALEHSINTRVFQDKSAVDILKEVLEEGLAPYRREVDFSKLEGEYTAREYTVQYQESDLHFATRLMEEEGFGFVFAHDDDREVMQLVEKNADFGLVKTLQEGERIQLAAQQGDASDAEPLSRFELVSRIGPTALTLVDYNWTQPSVQRASTSEEDAQGRTREVYDHARGITFREYGGNHEYLENDLDWQLQLRMQAIKAEEHVAEGESRVIGMRPGLVFELYGHPDESLNQRYLVTRVQHRGTVPEAGGVDLAHILGFGDTPAHSQSEPPPAYSNRFECIPASVVYRKKRSTPKPRIHGVQTATVVGPKGAEIHADEHGRIKVQFHWDRQGQLDDRSSCYVRVGQSWAGAHWGATFTPRIGMEVIVTFVDGDPDRPIVTGCLYNGQQRPPYELPAELTKTTIKTRSTPDGEGFNELRFEDKKGSEEIFIHAEKDYNRVVKANESVHVGGNSTLSVSGTRSKTVTKDETNTLQANRTTVVQQNDVVTVHGEESVERLSKGSKTIETSKGRILLNSTQKLLAIQDSQHLLLLDGHAALKSSKKVWLEAGSKEGPRTTIDATSGGELFIKATSRIVLTCGESKLEMSNDGSIVLKGVTLTLEASDSKVVASDAGVNVKGAKIEVTAEGEAIITGSKVHVN